MSCRLRRSLQYTFVVLSCFPPAHSLNLSSSNNHFFSLFLSLGSRFALLLLFRQSRPEIKRLGQSYILWYVFVAISNCSTSSVSPVPRSIAAQSPERDCARCSFSSSSIILFSLLFFSLDNTTIAHIVEYKSLTSNINQMKYVRTHRERATTASALALADRVVCSKLNAKQTIHHRSIDICLQFLGERKTPTRETENAHSELVGTR